MRASNNCALEGEMGLLDSLASVAGGVLSGQNTAGDPKAALIQAVLGMLAGGGQQGGLAGLAQAFKDKGMGDVVQSWIGTGQNMPISADQITQVLGGAKLDELANSAGLSTADVSSHLSQLLPGIVDKLTPNGHIPEGGIQNAMSMLEGFLNRK